MSHQCFDIKISDSASWMPILWCHINVPTFNSIIMLFECQFFGATSMFWHYVLNCTRFSALKWCQDNAHQCTLMWHHFIQCHFDVALMCIILTSFFGWLGKLSIHKPEAEHALLVADQGSQTLCLVQTPHLDSGVKWGAEEGVVGEL